MFNEDLECDLMQEHLAENIIEIYRKHGRVWTTLRGNILYEKIWLDLFEQEMPKNANILDLGCGSGEPIAHYFIEKEHHVVGVDSSDVMISLAEENFPHHVWLNDDMRRIHLGQKFDGILAWDSFFHLTPDDQRKMFSQFSIHAKTDAMLMFTSGPSAGEAIGDLFGEALYHASLSFDEYTNLLHQSGFEVIKTIAEDPDCTGHTVWLAKKVQGSTML